jgi:hypothetical protein
MENDFLIIDDFISVPNQKIIESSIYNSYFPVYFQPKTILEDEYEGFSDENSKESFQLVHSFLLNGNSSANFHVISPVVFKINDYFNKICSFSRIKLNLNFQNVEFSKDNYYPPHVDFSPYGGFVGIYYANDSDGDTLIFNRNKEIVQRVSPKKGRMLLMKSNILHSGQPPQTSTLRAVVNFNFVPKS